MEKKDNSPAITKSYAKKMESISPFELEEQADRNGGREHQEDSAHHAKCRYEEIRTGLLPNSA